LLCGHKVFDTFDGGLKRLNFKGSRILITILFFHTVVLGWLLFRATSVHQVKEMLCSMLVGFHPTEFMDVFSKFLFFVTPLFLVQMGQLKTGDLMFLFKMPKIIKIVAYALMTYLVLGFGVVRPEKFIYFQF